MRKVVGKTHSFNLTGCDEGNRLVNLMSVSLFKQKTNDDDDLPSFKTQTKIHKLKRR
jgi:hypothetical protein